MEATYSAPALLLLQTEDAMSILDASNMRNPPDDELQAGSRVVRLSLPRGRGRVSAIYAREVWPNDDAGDQDPVHTSYRVTMNGYRVIVCHIALSSLLLWGLLIVRRLIAVWGAYPSRIICGARTRSIPEAACVVGFRSFLPPPPERLAIVDIRKDRDGQQRQSDNVFWQRVACSS